MIDNISNHKHTNHLYGQHQTQEEMCEDTKAVNKKP